MSTQNVCLCILIVKHIEVEKVLDSRPRGCWFEPHRRHCVVSLSKNINPSLVLVHPRRTRPFITERLLMGSKESNQTNIEVKRSLYLGYCLNILTITVYNAYLLIKYYYMSSLV